MWYDLLSVQRAVSKTMRHEEEGYLSEQLITCIGNKRALLGDIEERVLEVKKELGRDRLSCLDLFSGSGAVARLLKGHSGRLIANDLERYSYVVNSCHLTNRGEYDPEAFRHYLHMLNEAYEEKRISGVITENYAPKDENNITKGERVFYTTENARIIDTYRTNIDALVPEGLRRFFLARLVTEASVHTNTAGVFKGFYKDKNTGVGKYGGSGENALSRIRGRITLTEPVLSRFECETEVYQKDANELAREMRGIDLCYIDPPYDQHPYGSNYFMLNLILENRLPQEISAVSGIPRGWNRSAYNKRKEALAALEDAVSALDAKYLLVSYNNEGFIGYGEMTEMLGRYGSLSVREIRYNAFRGSRNLGGRERYTNEYLFLLKKEA